MDHVDVTLLLHARHRTAPPMEHVDVRGVLPPRHVDREARHVFEPRRRLHLHLLLLHLLRAAVTSPSSSSHDHR